VFAGNYLPLVLNHAAAFVYMALRCGQTSHAGNLTRKLRRNWVRAEV